MNFLFALTLFAHLARATNFKVCENVPSKKYVDETVPRKNCNPSRSSAIDDLANLKMRKDFVQSTLIQTKAKIVSELNQLSTERQAMIACTESQTLGCLKVTAALKSNLETRLQTIRFALALTGRSALKQDTGSAQLSPEINLPPIGGGKSMPRLSPGELETARQIQARALNNINLFIPRDKQGKKHNPLTFAHQCMPELYPLWNTGKDPDTGYAKWRPSVVEPLPFSPDEKPDYAPNVCSEFTNYSHDKLSALRANAMRVAEQTIAEYPFVLHFGKPPVEHDELKKQLMESQNQLQAWRAQVEDTPVDDLSLLVLYPSQASAVLQLHPEYCGAVEEMVTRYKTTQAWKSAMKTAVKVVFGTSTCMAIGGVVCGPAITVAWAGADMAVVAERARQLKGQFAAQLEPAKSVVDVDTVRAADAEAVVAATALMTSPVSLSQAPVSTLFQYASAEGERSAVREALRSEPVGTSDEMLPGITPTMDPKHAEENGEFDNDVLTRQILFTAKSQMPVHRPKTP